MLMSWTFHLVMLNNKFYIKISNLHPQGGHVALVPLWPPLVLGYPVVLEGPSLLEFGWEVEEDPGCLGSHENLQHGRIVL